MSPTIDTIEKDGANTRIRSHGRRMHLDTNGLTAAVLRQSISRAVDPRAGVLNTSML